jgi:hypothetical protein
MDDKDLNEPASPSGQSPDRKLKIPRSFLILGGVSILVMMGAVLYTVFFYLSLPNHRELDQAGESIRHVPLPVPPNTFLPSGSGKTVDVFEKPDFTLKAGTLTKARTGFDGTFTLIAKTGGPDGNGLSFAIAGTPRWVDSNRNSGEGMATLSTATVFKRGVPGTFSIHFSRMPTAPSIDIYIGLTGVLGVKGDRYLVHFSNLKIPPSPS